MPKSPLNVNVYVAPMRPFVGPPPQGPGDDAVWSPMSSTLISGENEAILVDTLITNEQVDEFAEWIRSFDKSLTGIYITHGHSDHWIGLARLLEHFPRARGFATAEVVERARFETTTPAIAAYWQASFPGELPTEIVLPEVMGSDELELEGELIRAMSVGQSDTEHSTVLHVPSTRAVIAGDVVYNGVHMMTAETDRAGREAWIASLDVVAELAPEIVVAGHKRVGTSDGPENIAASQQYLRDFSRIVDEEESVEDIVNAMLALHGDRDNPRVLWHGARTAVARRAR